MSKIATEKICPEIWYIVAGRKNFNEGNQYDYLRSIKDKISLLMNLDSSDESIIRLEIISRTIDTLKKYIDHLGERMKNGSKYEENVKTWNTIGEIASLIEDNIYDYKIFETNRIAKIHKELQTNLKKWLIRYYFILFGVILFCFLNALTISQSIAKPIKQLYENTSAITEKYLNKFSHTKSVNEITGLKSNFELLINELGILIKKSMEEQEKARKAELTALQEQINPHFLYNTLDSLIWMIEKNDNDAAIKMVKDLSQFYRISLSKGRTWVKVKEEIAHIDYYLRIQKVRYADILDYKISIDEKMHDLTILKFILQPIVENAIYHGIKQKRQKGEIIITGKIVNDLLHFEITDNGIGMSPEKLEQVKESLNKTHNPEEIEAKGYGLINVNQRIKIYYGNQYGIKIESSYNVGTKVTIEIPYFVGQNLS
jgi:two-component system sensor histidine kinase YesM